MFFESGVRFLSISDIENISDALLYSFNTSDSELDNWPTDKALRRYQLAITKVENS